MKISEISDLEWDQKLKLSPYGEFFQTSFWKNQVCTFIGGKGHFFLYENYKKSWLIPLYIGAPWSSGFRLGSVGYGGPIPLGHIQDPLMESYEISNIVLHLSKHCQLPCTGLTTFPMKEWSSIEINQKQFLSFTQMILLRDDPSSVFNHIITGNVRTAIRRAEQLELQVNQIENLNDVEMAHRLLCETQKRVNASYTTPFPFFSSLSANHQVSIWSVTYEGEMIAMSLLLIHDKKAFHLFHGWKRCDIPQGTNQLLIWKMIQHAISSDCHSFNMGESHTESLRIAKQRWGCEDVPILKMNSL